MISNFWVSIWTLGRTVPSGQKLGRPRAIPYSHGIQTFTCALDQEEDLPDAVKPVDMSLLASCQVAVGSNFILKSRYPQGLPCRSTRSDQDREGSLALDIRIVFISLDKELDQVATVLLRSLLRISNPV